MGKVKDFKNCDFPLNGVLRPKTSPELNKELLKSVLKENDHQISRKLTKKKRNCGDKLMYNQR